MILFFYIALVWWAYLVYQILMKIPSADRKMPIWSGWLLLIPVVNVVIIALVFWGLSESLSSATNQALQTKRRIFKNMTIIYGVLLISALLLQINVVAQLIGIGIGVWQSIQILDIFEDTKYLEPYPFNGSN